ncbi:MAG: alpha-hydroxy-acid oxidizing protein [Myxococcales bacterium]|nr:alpha-hydroxy-acid oxidizing protein [Myxococcales bacterium]
MLGSELSLQSQLSLEGANHKRASALRTALIDNLWLRRTLDFGRLEQLRTSIHQIDDLRLACLRRMPPVTTDYFTSGAGKEITLRRNQLAFERVVLATDYGNPVDQVDVCTRVLDHELAMPILGAPVGSLRTLHPCGEAVAMAAMGELGTAGILSTLTGTTMEAVKRATRGPAWFQLYLCGGRETALRGIERARRAGYSALVLTIDTPVAGIRMPDKYNGFNDLIAGRLLGYLRAMPSMLSHPRWLGGFLTDGGLMEFVNIIDAEGRPMPYTDIASQLAQSATRWEDIEWIRRAWGDAPIVIKGIHTLDEAEEAQRRGAEAIVISNHGGRQLDRVRSSLETLIEVGPVLRGRGTKMQILFDSGIRSGFDVAIALALGADAVLVGRAYAFGLGAAGGAGVVRAFEILRDELAHTMRHWGCRTIEQLKKHGERFVSAPTELFPGGVPDTLEPRVAAHRSRRQG